MSFADLNFIAILVVTILNIVLGTLWYSATFFGTMWAKEHRFGFATLKPTAWHYAGTMLVSLLMAGIFSLFIHWFNISALAEGLKLGFFLWLGFIATTHFSGVLWAKKPWKVYLIDTGFQLVNMLMMGAILSLWKS